MTSALVGATGFVGGNLQRDHRFDALFNSANIESITGTEFDLVVCAAAPATMWAANRDPAGDLANLERLMASLRTVRAGRFVLVSTIAVLADPAAGLTEATDRFEQAKAYGRNRRWLEEACADRFAHCHILRLPALYGAGLRKNFMFDILNPVPSFLRPDVFERLSESLPAQSATLLRAVFSFSEALQMFGCDRAGLSGADGARLAADLAAAGLTALNFTNPDSRFQFYGLSRLWRDITTMIAADLPMLHCATAPLRAGDIYSGLTGSTHEVRTAPVYAEDMRTGLAVLFGGRGDYLSDTDTVMRDLLAFYRREKAA